MKESEIDSEIFDEDEEGFEGEEYEDGDKVPSPSINNDYRIMWMREKVLKFLGLGDMNQLFNDLLSKDDRQIEEDLLNFLVLNTYGVTDLAKKQVFFYKTYRSETIQEEVSVWEESFRKITTMSSIASKGRPQRLTKSAPGKVEKQEEERKDKKTKKGKKGKSKKGPSDMAISKVSAFTGSSISSTTLPRSFHSVLEDSDGEYEAEDLGGETEAGIKSPINQFKKKSQTKSDSSLETVSFIPAPEDEDKYILTKKVVDKVVQVPVLHMFCGEIDGRRTDLGDVNLIYFLRTSEEGIKSFESFDECCAEMPSYIVVGSLNGKFLSTLNRMLTYVFKPLVEKQFRGPGAAQRLHAQEMYSTISGGEHSEKTAAALQTVADSQASAFVRPSDYRRISLAADKLESKITEWDEQKNIDKISEKEEMRIDQQSIEFLRSKKSKVSLSAEQSECKKIDSFAESKSHKSISTSIGDTKTEKEEKVPIEPVKKDILDYLNKLSAIVEWTLEHIEGDNLLIMPKIPELTDPEITDEALSSNKRIIEQLEEAVMAWGKHIQKILDSYARKEPRGNSPMTEYDNWRERETALSILVEQLKTSIVKRILSILNQSHSTIGSAFDYFQIELWKYYTEARDNNKFIFTVLRYFKLMNESDSFEAIADAIPSLMNGIRMIWVLSKYYCTEDKMVPLLERISRQLSQNVTTNLSVKTLFKKPLVEVLQKTEAAHKMMVKWKAAYLDTRRSIEVSGKGVRWEFDQRRLFKETQYISYVCKDLNTIASVLQDFYNIFGAELKSIINDPAQIDAIVKRVDKLIIPIKESDFNIFSEFNKENWDATMNWFNTQVVSLENEAKLFIDECFMELISAEEALRMLLKFRNMKTREAIQEQLSGKFDVIMQQFSKEISLVETLFNQDKRNPPLLTYHPPVAGAIFWERQLFHRLKDPVLLFQNVKELKNSDLKIFAFSQYMELAKQMKTFEECNFKAWIDKAQNAVVTSMKNSVLKVVSGEKEQRGEMKTQISIKKKKPKVKDRSILTTTHSSTTESLKRSERFMSKISYGTGDSVVVSSRTITGPKPSSQLEGRADSKTLSLVKEHKASTISAFSGKKDRKVTWSEMMHGFILVERQLKFKLNFNYHIFEIGREAELLEQLGFELPSTIRDVGIQRSRLHEDIEITEKMINQYNDIVDKLDDADVQLLKSTLQNMEKHMQPGVLRLNWYSLGIKDYALSCTKLLKSLVSIVTQMSQMKRDLDCRINFEDYNLCSIRGDPNDPNYQLQSCKAYFLEMEAKRTEIVCLMLEIYNSATPLLIKLESLIEETSTGRSLSMQLFYERFEYKIFTALIKCFIRNLKYLNNQLCANKPLFTVDVALLASEVVLRPSPGEIFTIILHNVKDMMDRARVFPRWKRGTCLVCNLRMEAQLEEYIVFSFYEDIMNIQVINDLIRNIQDTAQGISVNCLKYLHRWKKYSKVWFLDKRGMCEKFVANRPTLKKYDEKISFYGTIIDEINELNDYFDTGSVRINLKPLFQEIIEHSIEWKTILGKCLLEETLESMLELKTLIERCREEIELVISGLDRFKIIMQAITDVKKMAIQAEIQYLLYQETFRTLRMHGINFLQEDEEMAYKLQHDWESLYLGAMYRSATLESTKDRFCDITAQEIENFIKEFLDFAEEFEKNGPGSVGDDLDRGMKMMEEYGKRIEVLEEKRLDLVNAEVLFDLQPTDYSLFIKVKNDYKGMETLYKLYKQQKNARDVWSKTLWANLNPQQLMDGMDNFLKEFRKLPRTVRLLSVGQALDATMKGFRNSVPLFVELKNEAMRERHWQELMDKTGKHFDMSPDRSEDK